MAIRGAEPELTDEIVNEENKRQQPTMKYSECLILELLTTLVQPLLSTLPDQLKDTSNLPDVVREYPRLEGPNHAGRDFIFTFGDNRPQPTPVLFIAPYYGVAAITCNVTYYVGKEVLTNEILVDSGGVLLDAPKELVIRLTPGELTNLTDCKSVHITADAEIVVYGFSNAIFSADAFTALPTDILGTDYVIPSSPHSYTDIEVTSMIDTSLSFEFPSEASYYHPSKLLKEKAQQLSLVVKRHQTISLLADIDLSGTKVTSDCPVAVMSGNKKGSVSGITGDHMYEMIPPISRLGKTYITSPIIRRSSGDVYRLIGARDKTVCQISRLGSYNNKKIIEIGVGETHVMNLDSDEYNLIECSTSALLTQYAKSEGDIKYGDPFMSLVPALIQFDSVYTLSCLQPKRRVKMPFDHYISILIQDTHTNGLKIDDDYLLGGGLNKSQDIDVVKFYSIPGVEYTHIVLSVSDGVHRLEHDNPTVTFGVMVYGLKKSESYGYPGGMRLTLSGPDCIESRESDVKVNDNENNDCDWLVDEELYDGIDNDGDGRIDEDLAANEHYPILNSLKRSSHGYSQKKYSHKIAKYEEETKEANGDWSMILVAFLLSVILLSILLALIVYIKKSQPIIQEGYAPAEFRNRFGPKRISIRSVWTGRKKQDNYEEEEYEEENSQGNSSL
ncbi:uncharacterized protein [Watersipora subatra]|uniref:uncharacterized protein n=1 Tax=Watersipora subatra TaxID=2589382 RepID=UPI00355C37B2